MKDVQEIIKSLDGEELCKYYSYSLDCPGGVSGGPNGQIYLPCADGLREDDFDLEAYLADMEDADENEDTI